MSNKRKQDRRRRRAQKAAKSAPKDVLQPMSKPVPPSPAPLQLVDQSAHPGRPIWLDEIGEAMPDPHALLGLDRGDEPSLTDIRNAFADRLRQVSAEADPDQARELREARDQLIKLKDSLGWRASQYLVPDPGDYGLPEVERPATAKPQPTGMSAHARLCAAMALYALLEDALEHGHGSTHPSPLQGDLFN